MHQAGVYPTHTHTHNTTQHTHTHTHTHTTQHTHTHTQTHTHQAHQTHTMTQSDEMQSQTGTGRRKNLLRSHPKPNQQNIMELWRLKICSSICTYHLAAPPITGWMHTHSLPIYHRPSYFVVH